MKLVKNKRLEEGSGQCTATTKSGSRCSRDAAEHGYCKQHYRLYKEKGLIVDVKGTQKITQIPPPPEELKPTGKRHWQIYCQYLIDQGRLFEVHLLALGNLCYLEDQLVDVKRQLEEHGAVNIYENGIQRNGYASHFDKLLTHIRSLRADLDLNAPSGNSSASAEEQPTPKQGYSHRKTKDF